MVPQTSRRGTTPGPATRPADGQPGGSAEQRRGSRPSAGAAARQRWRLVLARDATAPELAGRELADAWDEAIEATGLPVYRPAGRNRPAIAFGAPVPAADGARGRAGRHRPDRVLPTLARARGARGRCRRPAGGSSTCSTSGSARRRWPARSRGRLPDRVTARTRPTLAEAAARSCWRPTAAARATEGRRASSHYDLRPLLVDVGVAVDPGRRSSSGPGRGSTRSSARAGRRRSSRRSARLGVALAVAVDRPGAADPRATSSS